MISELTAEQRWLWIGLLLLAGDSTVPGVIFRRKDENGHLLGYSPSTLAEMLDVNILVYEDGISRMISKSKISIDILGVISILNWSKYQSEYQRQKPYRERADCNPSNNLDVDVDVDVEEERVKATTTKRSLRRQPTYSIEFEKFWGAYPKEGRFHKEASSRKFAQVLKNDGTLSELEKGLIGYLNHLKHERVYNKFEKHPMHLLTFMTKGRYETYIGFKYEPPL